jgi:hypothetical protein
MPKNQIKSTNSNTEESAVSQSELLEQTVQNNTNIQKRKSAISKFANPEYNALISNICICQVINHMEAEKVGLFIKDKYLAAINWQGQEPTHKHTFSSGTPEMGVLLQSPRMHILGADDSHISLLR